MNVKTVKRRKPNRNQSLRAMGWQHCSKWSVMEQQRGSWNTASVEWNTDGDGWMEQDRIRAYSRRAVITTRLYNLPGARRGRPLICHCTPPAAFELPPPPGNTGSYLELFKLYNRKQTKEQCCLETKSNSCSCVFVLGCILGYPE